MVNEGRLLAFVTRALLLLASLAVLAGAATLGHLPLRASALLAVALLVPGLLWLVLRP